jgi:signal transduction histidine kinase
MSPVDPPTSEPREARRWGRFRGLKVQIVLWTVLPLTLVLIGVAFTGVYSHEQTMRVLVEERDRALAAAKAGQIGDLLRERVMALQMMAAQPVWQGEDQAAQRAALEAAGDLVGLLAGGVVLVNEAGELLAAGGEGRPAWAGEDRRLVDLAAAMMSRQDVVVSAAYHSPSDVSGVGVWWVLLGVPVTREGEPSAVSAHPRASGLVGPISLSSLELDELLGQVAVGEHGVVSLVDGAGQVLAQSPNSSTHPAPGERVSLAYAPVDLYGLDWRVVVEQPWHEVVGPVLRYSQFVPLVAALAAVVSLLTLYYGVRSIAQPLRALGQRAERVAWGDFSGVGAPVGGVQEIDDLRRTLDQMARRVQSYQLGMHDYIAAITQGQEEERRRLARELHDDTAQALIALGQRVEMAQKALPAGPDSQATAERLATARAMIAETLEGVRRFSRDLRPTYLDDLGLVPALEMLVRVGSFGAWEPLEVPETGEPPPRPQVELAVVGEVRRLSPDMELAAYRIVQEAVNNVIQHAQAAHAWIEVSFEAERLTLAVRDDGQGFDVPRLPDSLTRSGHFGLMGIQERANLFGGQVTIQSHVSPPGADSRLSRDSLGTMLQVRLPYTPPRPETGDLDE